MAAAVSDWTPAITLSQKAKKGQEVDFSVKPTQDILKWLGEHRQEGQCLIGFAMETENLLENARDKLLRKKADWIFANALHQEKNSVFGADHNHILAISQQKQIAVEGSKEDIAVQLLQRLFDQPHSEVGKP
jgi:phosphopantothenoylcysteine decarboxylase/phosphopantothenate--cysteine ligase